jgi:predicted RNA-binding Zn ribbon-like protein
MSVAPGALGLVQEFINTLDLDSGTDDLCDPPALASWMSARELAPRRSTAAAGEVAVAHDVRDGLRALCLVHSGEPVERDAVARLDARAHDLPLRVAFDREDSPRLEAATGGVLGALGRLLAIVEQARVEGTWERLKICRDDACQWAFYDSSRNRSGTWCSMAVCGNRAKARAYRQRSQKR